MKEQVAIILRRPWPDSLADWRVSAQVREFASALEMELRKELPGWLVNGMLGMTSA